MPMLAGLRVSRAAILSRRRRVAGSAFAMTQLAASNRIYQRSTTTGGGNGTGQGAIPVSVDATATGSVQARCRSVADGTTILQAPFAAPAITSTGAQTLTVTGVDARLGWFYLDLLDSSGEWKLGTVPVGMGRLTALSGQSLAVRMLGKIGDTTTNANLGITPSPNSSTYATYIDSGRNSGAATWRTPADGTDIDSAFASDYLNRQISEFGVNCGLIGHARGSSSITLFIPGGSQSAQLRANLQAAGGFENFIWFQGHSDSATGMASATYQGHLTTLFDDMTAQNAVRGSSYTKLVSTVPNINSTSFGTSVQIQTIRQAAATWTAANSGIHIQPRDLSLYDGVHQDQAGNLALSRHMQRAATDTGATIEAGTRPSNSAVITLSVTHANGATSLSTVGSPANRFKVYAAGDTATPLTINSLSVGASSIAITLASAPANTTALDVYFTRAPDPANNGAADMIYDNALGGFAVGRHPRPTLTPVTVAAPGGTPAPTPGPNLIETSAVYSPSATGFGQKMTGGRAYSPANTDLLSGLTNLTVATFIEVSTISGTQVAVGQGGRCWIGVNNTGRLIGAYNSDASTTTYIGGTTTSANGTNPVVTDGVRRHIALVAGPSGGSLYVDGVRIATNSAPLWVGSASNRFTIRAFFMDGSFPFTGAVDEVAVFNTAYYSGANFSAQTAPYTGTETGLIGLYHLDGNANAS